MQTNNYRHTISAINYAKPLLNLDEGMRIEIMHILLNSITGGKQKEEKKYDLYSCFSGSWGDDVSPEKYCEELREGISEPKEIEAW